MPDITFDLSQELADAFEGMRRSKGACLIIITITKGKTTLDMESVKVMKTRCDFNETYTPFECAKELLHDVSTNGVANKLTH